MKKLTVLFLVLAMAGAAMAQVLPGRHMYRVTAYKNGNNNIYSVSNYAEVYTPPTVFIPTAFTPNSDGMNDMFRVKGENLQNFRLMVYDRWGEKIFESSNPNDGWDGTFKGNPVQNDTYVYQVTAANLKGSKLTGAVTLVR
jgi:gliding motility-associated-like protein